VNVNKGPVITIRRKILTGLTRTDPGFLSRFITIDEGDTLTERTISAAEKSATVIPFVNFAPPAIVRPREGYTESDLEFRFTEKRQFRFEGGAGYQPDDETGLVWSVNAAVRNLFGRGRQVSILSERREKGRNRLEVGYRQPLFALGVGSLGLKVATRDYRDRFYEFTAGADYQTHLNREWSTGVELSWAGVEPSLELPSYNRFESGFSITREAVDNPLNPGRGLTVGSSVAYSHRRYDRDTQATVLSRSFNETRVRLPLDFYQPAGRKMVTHVGLNYAGLETSESLPPLSELVLVGGPGTLRGFRNEQFAVLRTAYGTIEPRLRFEGGNFFLFYDAAYLNNRVPDNPGSVRTEESYRFGYGLGLALTNPGRAVRISLGWNRDLAFDEPRLAIEMFSDI
jgi:translocation and assembly module TamA